MKYHRDKHMPMVRYTLGAAYQGIADAQRLGGPMLGSRAAYVATGHVLFESLESSQTTFPANTAKFMADTLTAPTSSRRSRSAT